MTDAEMRNFNRDTQISFTNELGVIGSILIGGIPALEVAETAGVMPRHFINQLYGEMYANAQRLRDAGRQVNAITMKEIMGDELSDRTIREIRDEVITSHQCGAYAAGTVSDSKDRDVRNRVQSLLDAGAGFDEINAQFPAILDEVGKGTKTGLVMDGDQLMTIFTEYQVKAQKGGMAIGSGFPSLDYMLSGQTTGGGFLPGSVYVFAGRTGEGKSTLAIVIADNMARKGNPVLYVSLEMDAAQVTARRIAQVIDAPVNNLLYNPRALTDEKLQDRDNVIQLMRKYPFYMANAGSNLAMTIDDIVAAARSIRGLKAIVVDHIGLVRGTQEYRGNITAETQEVTRKLKQLALTMGIVVIELSQYTRDAVKRGDPGLNDLRGGGTIEQDADAVVIVRRADYENENPNGSEKQITKLIAQKNRHARQNETCYMMMFPANNFVAECDISDIPSDDDF